MPTTEVIQMFAMYVVGKVESNHNWSAVNMDDPITIGMMQWFGTRAANLLQRTYGEEEGSGDNWDYISANAPDLAIDVATYFANDADFWNERHLTRVEANALVHIMKTPEHHVLQQTQWISDCNYYISKLTGWGLSTTRPKQLIYAMCMYHQSPKRCREVIRACGGSASLYKMHTTCLNNSILKNYRTRYTSAYNLLNNWDGTSMPPNFGQILTDEDTDGGDSPQEDSSTSELGYIIESGDTLVLYGPNAYKSGVIFHRASGQRWVCGTKPDSVAIPDDPEPDDGDDTTVTAEQKLADRITSYIGQFKYSQGSGRLSPHTSGYTDCSGLVWLVYKEITGKKIGTWTGAQKRKGQAIYTGDPANFNWSNAHKGDLVFYCKGSNTGTANISHVEMYIGNTQVCGHGGPGNGPTIKSAGRNKPWVHVRRYL